jgi:ectoine hydroxylase-related dioxygenase (phytanoyl-CoA dioxygenase family)
MRVMQLTPQQRATWERDGHVTIPGVFGPKRMIEAIDDLEAWGRAFLAGLPEEKRFWYLDPGVVGAATLRKLDNPVFERPVFRALASDPVLVGLAEQLVGKGLRVYFSQLFLKPPHGGGPKCVHQDNFYFGPNDKDGIVTAWIALDDATVENGCMRFGNGTHRGPIQPHRAPPEKPFELAVVPAIAMQQEMTPAPVPRGGVSFHHGNVFHQSGDNHSDKWRRACAVHYVNRATRFVTPALPYDERLVVEVS